VRRRRHIEFVSTVLLLLVLLACGLGPTATSLPATAAPAATVSVTTSLSRPRDPAASAAGKVVVTPSPEAYSVEALADDIADLVNSERLGQGLSALRRDPELDVLALQYAQSGLADEVIQSSDLAFLQFNSWWVTYGGHVPRLSPDMAAEQMAYVLGEEQMRSTLLRPEARATGMGVAVVDDSIYFVQAFDVMATAGGDGEAIHLQENSAAVDPAWEELRAFLLADQTDARSYDSSRFVCADYAEALHNSAERAGIRAGYVVLEFGEGGGHAIDAFVVERSLVFIEPQGDQVAYVEVGKPYGVVPLQAAAEFDYAYLEHYASSVTEWLDDLDRYNAAVGSFNQEITAFDRAVAAYNRQPSDDEYDRLTEWQDRLDQESAELEQWDRQLRAREAELGLTGGFWDPTEPLQGVADPTVTRVYVHW